MRFRAVLRRCTRRSKPVRCRRRPTSRSTSRSPRPVGMRCSPRCWKRSMRQSSKQCRWRLGLLGQVRSIVPGGFTRSMRRSPRRSNGVTAIRRAGDALPPALLSPAHDRRAAGSLRSAKSSRRDNSPDKWPRFWTHLSYRHQRPFSLRQTANASRFASSVGGYNPNVLWPC